MNYSFDLSSLLEDMGAFILFRDRIRPALERRRGDLDAMYSQRIGRPEIDPVLLAGISLLQFMERLPDRQAVRACLFDVRWRLALGLPSDWHGMNASTLCRFRERLCRHGQAKLVLDAGLEAMRQAGYLRGRGPVRIDSTHMLGLVADMSRLECIVETLGLALEFLQAFGGQDEWMPWLKQYARRQEGTRQPSEERLKFNLTQAGLDMQAVLAKADTFGEAVRAAEPIVLLRRVFDESFVLTDTVAARPATLPGAVQNPHDPYAEWSTKNTLGKKGWVGYKVQVCETVAENNCAKGEPTQAVITAVLTQPATTCDISSLNQILETHVELGQEMPETVHVDAGYISAGKLAEAEKAGFAICGPIPDPPHGAARFGSDAFKVDVPNRKAVCPAGATTASCSFINEKYSSRSFYYFEWPPSACQACPLKAQCISTKTKQNFRCLQVNEHHMLAQERRQLCQTGDYKKRMQRRNAIEGTISELKRGYGIRRSRYRGLHKSALLTVFAAAACNLRRWAARMGWQKRKTV